MAGLVPAIHVGEATCARRWARLLVSSFTQQRAGPDVDGRHKAGHDGLRSGIIPRVSVRLTRHPRACRGYPGLPILTLKNPANARRPPRRSKEETAMSTTAAPPRPLIEGPSAW